MTAPPGLSITARWQDWAGSGLEHLVLTIGADGIAADSVVMADGFALHYQLFCDPEWCLRRLDMRVIGSGQRLLLQADGLGHWSDAEGRSLPHLDGAIDVDLPATPFTNTLPIRRLGLSRGEAADIVTAYVELPGLAVIADPQRYTCLDDGHYRYESLDSDFMREVAVDGDGLVLEYPGLFRRLA